MAETPPLPLAREIILAQLGPNPRAVALTTADGLTRRGLARIRPAVAARADGRAVAAFTQVGDVVELAIAPDEPPLLFGLGSILAIDTET